MIADIPAVPRSLLLWRALTQWLGGLGIVVLFVAVLPSLGVGARKLYRFEASGTDGEGMHRQIRQTARALWLIYVGLTVMAAVLLKLAGMSAGISWFDSVAHAFTTVSTAGFSTHNASIHGMNSAWVDTIVIVFMVLGGVNFGLYYLLIRGDWRSVWRDTELRVYLSIVVVASVVVVVFLVGRPIVSTTDALKGEETSAAATVGEATRYGMFQVVAHQTGTGYCTADFNPWDFVPQAMLWVLMFFGASAGSTSGGIKISRLIILFKILRAEIERVFRPNVIRTIKVGRTEIDAEHRQGTLAYILGIILLFGLGAAALMVLEDGKSVKDVPVDFRTVASASAAMLNNIGPGFGEVGAFHNYAWFSAPSKVVMSVLMALGRLELFAIIVLSSPRFWRTD